MAFGWNMVNSDKEVEAECVGPAYGQPLSFRAEAYGLLSLCRFILQLMEYYKTSIDNTIEVFMDNKDIISQ
eukprot:12485085-Ditylum_brightwellii.AAC.1